MLKKCTLLLMMGMLVLFSSCKKDTVQELESRLKSMGGPSAELGAVEYTISKIIATDHNAFYKLGDRKILFSCYSTMKAGVDISNFSAENIVIDEANKAVTVTLPKPKIIAFNMPAEGIKLEWEKSIEDIGHYIGQCGRNHIAGDRFGYLGGIHPRALDAHRARGGQRVRAVRT